MALLRRQNEIDFDAPIGAAADNIDDDAYLTALGMSIRNKPSLQRLWKNDCDQ
jgi:hypothetical protein